MENSIQLKEQIEQYLNNNIDNTTMFVVDVKVLPTNKIEVFIDRSDTNITIDECAKTSRKLEEYLESNQLVGEKYTLEVSSPGMDQPFKVPQQFLKNIDKNVEILMNDGTKDIGILIAYNPDSVEIQTEKKVKKEIITENKTILLSEIKSIKKHFIFKI
ncbi:MAG: ribosome assembly cofactor RimP [Sphingobacteriales bacterium]|jgi:ribosome maturation factor RimP|nr:MAG: ribosome assembly cofactor RimP [Sphingobacteriales bacterium]